MARNIVTRWACGRRFYDSPLCVVELEFEETSKQLILVVTPENQNKATGTIGYNTRFLKSDDRIQPTRSAAVAGEILRRQAEIEHHEKEISRIRTQLSEAHKLLLVNNFS